MRLGLVGSEAAKFTPSTERIAREIIQRLLLDNVTTVVSGACHLGGIDIWAVEEASSMGITTIEFKPKILKWEGGFKQRNIEIAQFSEELVCITVKELPSDYKGMRFTHCYHCQTPPNHHVKSGGCWTKKYAERLGRKTQLIVI